MAPKYPAPPTIDPSKISVRQGDFVVSPGQPVDVAVEGFQDGIPTPGVQPKVDPFTKTPVVVQPTASQMFNWAQLNPVDLDRIRAVIQAQHPNVLWERSALCPARLSNGDHDPDCDLCMHGILFFDAIQCSMIVQSATMQQQFYIQGQYKSGSVMVTSLPDNPITYGDRITVITNTCWDKDIRQRTSKVLVDKLKYPAIDVKLLRTKTTTYVKDADFTVTAEGAISWTTQKSRRPADGDWYSIVYTRRPTYIITDLMHEHRERRVKQGSAKEQTIILPIQGLAKATFLVRDESKDAPAVKYQNPFGGI